MKKFNKILFSTIFVLIFSFSLFACKNTDTYLKSYYFIDNQSEKVVFPENLTNETNTTALAKAVVQSVVAIESIKGQMVSVGSGVCVKSGGYILTNEHVISGADKINLYLSDNKTASAIVLWKDEIMDIAILKSSVAIPYLEMGDNSKTVVGEDVLAVGTPLSLNFTHTFTKGIVSAIGRTIKINTNLGMAYMQNLIQHDASINPGNSGGPLINSKGQVIGINTLKITMGEGLGFAIPINSVVSIVENVYNDYNYKTPYIGIFGYDNSLNAKVNSHNIKGFYVESVAKNSPANVIGLQKGDVIVSLNGIEIDNTLTLQKQLYKNKTNQTISLAYLRNGQINYAQIKLVSHPAHSYNVGDVS